jgi:hypothetical protein
MSTARAAVSEAGLCITTHSSIADGTDIYYCYNRQADRLAWFANYFTPLPISAHLRKPDEL